MIQFFKKKHTPKFWEDHISKVQNSKKYSNYEDIRFVALDTETTGFDYENDRILCIGAVAIKNNKILVSDAIEIYVKQDVFNKETVKIHGIRKDGNEVKFSEEEAIIKFIDYLDDAVIVAHHTAFDVNMINMALKRLKVGPLESKQLDTNYIHKKIAKTGRCEMEAQASFGFFKYFKNESSALIPHCWYKPTSANNSNRTNFEVYSST